MPTFKQIVAAIGIAILGVIITGIVGFVSSAHLEVSFDKLKDFEFTNLKSWAALGTSVRFDYQASEPREFFAFWGDNDQGKTVVRSSTVNFKNFRLVSRIRGVLIDDEDKSTYGITGYYNSKRLTFAHRGPLDGVGVYVLNSVVPKKVEGQVYFGYALWEDDPDPGRVRESPILRCPFVMIERTPANFQAYGTVEKAQAAFRFLQTPCVEFNMPAAVDEVAETSTPRVWQRP